MTDIYAKLNNTQLDGKFNPKLDLDNGLKVTSLLAVLAGGALLWWNPAGWFVIAMGVASIAVGAYKAVRGFFSSDYKKSQQRKATEDNLHSVTWQLRDLLRDGLKSALPDMQKKVLLLEQAIAAPAKTEAEIKAERQAAARARLRQGNIELTALIDESEKLKAEAGALTKSSQEKAARADAEIARGNAGTHQAQELRKRAEADIKKGEAQLKKEAEKQSKEAKKKGDKAWGDFEKLKKDESSGSRFFKRK